MASKKAHQRKRLMKSTTSKSNGLSFNFTPSLSDKTLTFAKLEIVEDDVDTIKKEEKLNPFPLIQQCETLSAAVSSRIPGNVARLLAARKASEVQDPFWQSELNAVLVYTLTSRQPTILNQVIEAGADISHHNQQYPLLFIALDLKEFESFQILLKHTPDSMIRGTLNSTHGSLFHAAVRSGNLEVVKQVAEIFSSLGLELGTKEEIGGLTPLHIAVRWLVARPEKVEWQWFSTEKSLKRRIEDGRAGKTRDPKYSNSNPMDVYGKRNNSRLEFDTSIVQFLLEKSANVNEVDKNGRTALHEAVITGCLDLVRMLLDKGADPCLADNKQYIPWMYGIIFRREEILALLEERSDITTWQFEGRSILHLSSAAGCLHSVKTLLSKGMDVQSVSTEGLTPLMEAVKHQRMNCVSYFLENPNCNVNQIHKVSALTLALEQANESKQTSLKILSALIEKGADLNLQNSDGESLLIANFNDAFVRKWLIESGADVNCADRNGKTCLYIAALKSQNQAMEIVAELMDFNIDMRLADKVYTYKASKGIEKETTAFKLAVESNHHELCELFLNAGCRGYLLKTWLAMDAGKDYLKTVPDAMKPIVQRIRLRISEPRRLEDIARQAVLSELGSTKVEEKVSSLPLPEILKIQMRWSVFLKWKQECYSEGVDV